MAVSRAEQILTSMINGTPYDQYPQSRLEDLLLQLKEVIEEGGGGGTPTAAHVSYDNTTSGLEADDVQDAIDEVFQSVSDGKELIADAITDKGVPTSATNSFATMAENIANISGIGSELYLLDPTLIDDVYGTGVNSGQCAFYVEKKQGGDYAIKDSYFATYDNNVCLHQDYLGNHCLGFLTKIPKEAKRLEIDVGITTPVYNVYNNSNIYISTSPIPNAMNEPGGTVLKHFYLTDYNASGPSDINNQEGITINSENKYVLDRQTVIVDLNNINVDSYLSIHNCDCHTWFRSIKCVF